MCPSALRCWLIIILALHSVNHGKSATDQRHTSLKFVAGSVFSLRNLNNDGTETSPHNKSPNRMDKIQEFPTDSKHFKFLSLSFPMKSEYVHQQGVKRGNQRRQEKQVQKSQDIIKSALDKEQTGVKSSKVKEYDEYPSGLEKSRDLVERPYLKQRVIHGSNERKVENIPNLRKVTSVFSVNGRTNENLFRCGPKNMCLCRNVKKTLRADCTDLNLLEFPKDLPNGVNIIDASYNNITHLSLRSLLMYPDLQEVHVSFNLIYKLTTTKMEHPLQILNLKRNKLKYLNENKLGVLADLRELCLSKNKITFISHQLLSGLKSLQTLDVSHNNLKKIKVTAFDSLVKLTTLRLNNNKRLGYSNATLPARLFKYLQSLRYLWIQGNANETIDRSYPNEALAYLSGLMELTIDGLAGDAELGNQIRNLTSLHSLVIGFQGNCFIQNMSSNFFQHVPFLLKLTFVGCPFHHIENGTFEKLDKLRNYSLAFPGSDYKFLKALEDLQSLPNTSLTDLALVGFMNGNTKCETLSRDEGKLISRYNLRNLYLDFNNIAYIEDEFINYIPKTLQKFHLRGNKFTFIDYRWNLLMNFTNLCEIDIRDQNIFSSVPPEGSWFGNDMYPKSDPYGQHVTTDTRDLQRKTKTGINFFEWTKSACNKQRIEYCSLMSGHDIEIRDTIPFKSNSQCNPHDPHQACIPPNLQVIRASGFTEFGRAILYHKRSANNLSYLDFSRGFFTDWGNGTLPLHVKLADFSDNFCDRIRPDFFPPNNQLSHLCINNNYLGPALSDDVNGTIFSRLQSLKYLNLAMNTIFKIPPSLFKGLRSLETLDIHENKLQILDLDFSLTPNLREIDLSENSITWITRRTRSGLDALAMNHSISINLMDNPLPCTCEGIEVLQWLANTRVVLKCKKSLTCNSETESQVPLGKIRRRIRSLNRKCIPNTDLLILSLFSCSIFIIVIVCGLLYKNRWKLIYARNIWLVNMYGFQPIGKGTSQRMYDAYVVYSEEDRDFVLYSMIEELEVKRGHKLCVEDRDFILGNFNFNNITCAIQNSTITLLLLSPDFLTSGQLEYATQMALMEQHNGQRETRMPRLTQVTTSELHIM